MLVSTVPAARWKKGGEADARGPAQSFRVTQVRPSTGTADQKESLQITARVGCMDGRWLLSRTHVIISFSSICSSRLIDDVHDGRLWVVWRSTFFLVTLALARPASKLLSRRVHLV